MMRSMKMTIGVGMLLLAGMLGGCASNSQSAAATGSTPVMASSKSPHAECLVCKYNADLACVDIDVDAKTPRTTWNGHDYCFCSETCRKEFQAHPERYAKLGK